MHRRTLSILYPQSDCAQKALHPCLWKQIKEIVIERAFFTVFLHFAILRH